MQALEAEMNGTGPATAVPGRRPPAREPRTTVLPPPPPNRNGFAYAAIAFLCVAAIGGSGGYLVLQRGMLAPEPVPIERDAPRPAEPAAERASAQVETAGVSTLTSPAADAGPGPRETAAQAAPSTSCRGRVRIPPAWRAWPGQRTPRPPCASPPLPRKS